MGKFFDEIPSGEIQDWILEQKIFWVASAPLDPAGHVNASPKGRESFNLVDGKACWYTDMTGSGNETISHMYEEGNGRITIMFIAFEGPPRIVRLFGRGKVFERGSPEFHALLPEGDERILNGTRAIIWVDIHKVGTSCGYSVPLYAYQSDRLVLDKYFEKHEESEVDEQGIPVKMRDYWNLKNSYSVDSLPGLKLATDPSKSLTPPFTLPSTQMSKGGRDQTQKGRSTEESDVTMASWQLMSLMATAFVMGVIATVGAVQIYSLYTQRHVRL